MKQLLKRAATIAVPTLTLIACGGPAAVKEEPVKAAPATVAPVKVETPPPVVDSTPAPVAQSKPQASLHPLDDPGNLLAKRKVYFEYDKSDIQAEFKPVIAAHANYLSSNPSAAIIIEGHCDERGTREYNMALGERRALAVKQALTSQGVAMKQITVVSYGEERPEDPAHNDDAWSKNRRAFISYTSR